MSSNGVFYRSQFEPDKWQPVQRRPTTGRGGSKRAPFEIEIVARLISCSFRAQKKTKKKEKQRKKRPSSGDGWTKRNRFETRTLDGLY